MLTSQENIHINYKELNYIGKISLNPKVLLLSPEKVAHLLKKENQALFDVLRDMSEKRLTGLSGLVLCGLTLDTFQDFLIA